MRALHLTLARRLRSDTVCALYSHCRSWSPGSVPHTKGGVPFRVDTGQRSPKGGEWRTPQEASMTDRPRLQADPLDLEPSANRILGAEPAAHQVRARSLLRVLRTERALHDDPMFRGPAWEARQGQARRLDAGRAVVAWLMALSPRGP